MSEYIEFGIWALWAVFGFGVGRLSWREKVVVAPDIPSLPKIQTVEVLPTMAPWTGEGPAPFRVVTMDGDVRYEGTGGGAARRHIEALRSERIEWRAYRDGRAWDWGPRE